MQFKLTAAELRCVQRRLVVVAQQMFVVRAAAWGCRGQQMLGQNHASAQAWAVRTVTALTDAIETVARCNDPRIGRWAFQILAEVLEGGRMFRRERRKVVDGFVDAGG